MICSVLDIKRIDIYTQFDKPLSNNELTIIRNMVIKRVEHQPLQYILGKTKFLDMEILLNNSVMIPRPETELLVNAVLADFNDSYRNYQILDIGTGSGCISLALAKYLPFSQIFAIDKSDFALITAKNNATDLAIKNIQFNSCDILKEIPTNNKFDIIVSNPPYIPIEDYQKLEPEVLKYEPREALTDGLDGLTFYKRYSNILKDLLKEDGNFYFEIGYNQRDILQELFESCAYKVSFVKDFNKIDRIIKGGF